MKKILTTFIIVSIIFPLAFALEYELSIGFIGLGETPQQAIFTIHNIGEKPLSKFSIYVDDELVRTIDGVIAPKQGIEFILDLKPGNHIVEVKTAEGVSNALDIETFAQPEGGKQQTTQSLFEEQQKNLTILVVLIFVAVVALIIVKKPKL